MIAVQGGSIRTSHGHDGVGSHRILQRFSRYLYGFCGFLRQVQHACQRLHEKARNASPSPTQQSLEAALCSSPNGLFHQPCMTNQAEKTVAGGPSTRTRKPAAAPRVEVLESSLVRSLRSKDPFKSAQRTAASVAYRCPVPVKPPARARPRASTPC